MSRKLKMNKEMSKNFHRNFKDLDTEYNNKKLSRAKAQAE